MNHFYVFIVRSTNKVSSEIMYRQQFWCLRQNPYANTNQRQMREIVVSHNIVTCPFGHLDDVRNNVINGVYNEEESHSQDRKFIENMNIGDIVLIPFAGIKECLLARIFSEPIYGIETGKFTSRVGGKIQITNEGDTPFRPVGRKIQIINDIVRFNNMRVIPRTYLSHINPNTLPN